MKVIGAWISLTLFAFFATLSLTMAVVSGWRIAMNFLTYLGVL